MTYINGEKLKYKKEDTSILHPYTKTTWPKAGFPKSFEGAPHHKQGANQLLHLQHPVMIWIHITLLQSYPSTPPVLYLLPSTNVITYCSGSRLITLYPMYHPVTEVRVHGIWQTHLNMGHVQRQIKAVIQKIPLIKWQLVTHKLLLQFVTKYFSVGARSSETALCSCYVSTNQITQLDSVTAAGLLLPFWCMLCFYKLKCGFENLNEVCFDEFMLDL